MNEVTDQVCHLFRCKILDSQIDVFGHLNHAKYLEIFELARWDLITSNGYGSKEIEEHQFGPVILEAHIRYKSEVRSGMEIEILTYTQRHTKKIGKITQVMKSPLTGEIHANIELTYGLMDMKLRKLVPPTEMWLKAITGKNT